MSDVALVQRIRDLGSIAEGAVAGVFAGIPFAIAELIDPGFMGDQRFEPARMAASLALGQHVFWQVSRTEILIVGTIVHVVLSAMYGAIYGAANNSFSPRTRGRPDIQLLLGAAFGLAIWFVNFRVIAPISYPWLIVTSHLRQAALHSVFFGAPLGLALSAFERHALDDDVDGTDAINLA